MTVRPPAAADLPAVLELMRQADIALLGESEWTEEDLRELWSEVDLERDAWLVELDGRLAGYAGLERLGPRMFVEGYVHPALRNRGVGSELLRVSEERARARASEVDDGERVYLHNPTLAADASAPALYERHGYTPVRHFWRMVADLEAAPSVAPPAGVEIRPYEHPGELRTAHAVLEEAFLDHWNNRPRPFDEWARRHVEKAGFDPTLWLAAYADGEMVGASMNEWKSHGDWGWIAVLGVRPVWRRRGIGDALLRASLAEFFRRGERRVALGVDAENPTGATRLYERAGMHVLWEAVVYEKELRPAGPRSGDRNGEVR